MGNRQNHSLTFVLFDCLVPTPSPGSALDQLVCFFEKHDASRVSSAEQVLESSSIQEISQELLKQYGELPAGWAATACALVKGDAKRFLVEAAKAVVIPLKLPNACVVKWYIGSTAAVAIPDIDLEMYFEPEPSKSSHRTNFCQKQRLRLPEWPEGLGGEARTNQAGTLTLVFDNSFSWVTPKTVCYKTEVMEL